MTSSASSPPSKSGGSFSSATTRWQRLRRIRPTELWLGTQAVVVLPWSALALRRHGLRQLQVRLGQRHRGRCRAAHGTALDSALRIAWVVDRVAARGPYRANCLQRSVTLWWLLQRRGIASELRIGVRRRPGPVDGARLDFHAWVEAGGVVLNDVGDVRARFATFDRAIAPSDADWRR